MDSVLNLLALAAITPIAYNFPVGAKRAYDMEATFQGYIQFLGGRQATVQVNLGFTVEGLLPDDQKRPQVASELTDIKLTYNGAVMPMELKNVQSYFPRTTISLNPQGKVLKTDAPDVVLPIRLPGLDARRFPDISYLPVEFPEAGINEGVEWTFKKSLGGTEASYVVKPTKISPDKVDLDVRINQSYTTFEDAKHNVVQAESDGIAFRVETKLSGKGTVTFDRALGLSSLFAGETDADSVVTTIASGKTSPRKLHTTVRVKLKP